MKSRNYKLSRRPGSTGTGYGRLAFPVSSTNRAILPVLWRDPKLREAQGRATGTASAAQEARWLLERAAAHVSSCCAALDGFRDLDGKVAEAGAAALRAGDVTGRAALPADLVADRRARADALEDHGDALATHGLLEADAGAAAAADAAARDVLAKAADQAMQRTALDMVAELRDVEAKAGRLRALIGGLSAARSVNDPPLNWSVSQVTYDPVHPYMVEGAGPNWAGAATTWRAYRAALELDADASLPDDAPLPPGLAA